jgi:hypothetical protein
MLTLPFQGERSLLDRIPQDVALGCPIAALQVNVD